MKTMRNSIFACKIAILASLVPLGAAAQSIQGITTFGDSLSDNGNAFRATDGSVPPSPPYFNGRFTNDLVWVENLATELNVSTTSINFAFGGATSGTANTVSPLLPGVTTQIDTFLQTSPNADPDRVYVVWAGANDYLGGGITNPAVPVTNLSTGLQRLTSAGARTLIVPNLPDLGTIPGGANPLQSAALSQVSAGHNQGLNAELQTLARSNPDVNFIPLDIAALFNEVRTDPARFGFTNVTQPCLNLAAGAVCPNPNQFLFWDELHPTAAGHTLISQYALDLLTAPQTIAPQTEVALGVARRSTRDINGRLLTLRTLPQNPNQRWGVFVKGDLNVGNRDTTDRNTGFDFDTKGITVGADYRVEDDLALGLAFSYAHNNSDLNDDRGEIEVDSYSLSTYGSYDRDRFYADLLVNYGWNDFDITRNIKATGFDSAKADPSGTQFSARINTGYNLGSNQLYAGPTLGIRYSKVNIDGYTERNGSILNLNVDNQDADSVVLNVGAQVAYNFRTNFGTLSPYLAANYEHEFANGDREIVTELATQPGIPRRTEIETGDRDSVRLSAGVQTQFVNNLSIGINYETVLGKDQFSDHFMQAQLRYQF